MATHRTTGRTEGSVTTIDLQNFLVPISIFLSSIIIALSIFLAGRTIAISIDPDSVKSSKDDNSVIGNVEGEVAPVEPEEPIITTISIDDDAILGDPNAKVAIVEFSDYECPFCKRHWEETYSEIVKNYVDTGEVIIVFRDFPLSFHDPAATREAYAAECAREQGNDKTYYKMHDKIFETSIGNGAGISDDTMRSLAEGIGIDGNKLIDCMNSGKYADEVQKDLSEGSVAGINGTPGFVIGKLGSDGMVTGTIVSGAQPYTSFESIIKEYLGK
ncbi:DsbA family protein [Candidatus Dojkabacteria bacterium]|nr:DsbA family protein [Candidatus Dojkabacteria bacterium]